MEKLYRINEIIEYNKGEVYEFAAGEFEQCTFANFMFDKRLLVDGIFIDCLFKNCNLSMVSTDHIVFRDVRFEDCKLAGVHFENCNQFGLSFSFVNCTMQNASFYGVKIPNTNFSGCNIREADFSKTDLAGAVFENCDLTDALFEATILNKADLTSALGYRIDPQKNSIKKTKFSLQGLPGLLANYDIVIKP